MANEYKFTKIDVDKLVSQQPTKSEARKIIRDGGITIMDNVDQLGYLDPNTGQTIQFPFVSLEQHKGRYLDSQGNPASDYTNQELDKLKKMV
jgi:predicted O-methyltransferase YrrM